MLTKLRGIKKYWVGREQLVGLSSLAAWEVTLSGQWKDLDGQRDCGRKSMVDKGCKVGRGGSIGLEQGGVGKKGVNLVVNGVAER